MLADKKILLGITGSIAAYKAADWVRALRREGAQVTVVMTEAATRFISPLTLSALSGNRVYTNMFAPEDAEQIPHINLARQHDLIVVAPASAQTIARLAHGLADDLLSTVLLASSIPVLICPAMNSKMYLHPATQTNLQTIQSFGYTLLAPECGSMACGEEGPGRLIEWENARNSIIAAFAPQSLAGKSVLITAGPTREAFDPARFISNRSSGKMGYALATTALQRGAQVTLISGPTSMQPPAGVEIINVTTALEMEDAVLTLAQQMNVVVMSAAVSDFRPEKEEAHKVKKGSAGTTLSLVANPDILKGLGERKKQSSCFALLVGFAAESQNHLEEGTRKLREKNLDLIVVNDIGGAETGFETDTNRVSIIDRDQAIEELPLLSKEETAHRIWDSVDRLQEKTR